MVSTRSKSHKCAAKRERWRRKADRRRHHCAHVGDRVLFDSSPRCFLLPILANRLEKGRTDEPNHPHSSHSAKAMIGAKRHLALTALSYRTLVASYTHTSTLPARSRCCHWSLLFGCWKGVKKEKVFKKRVRVVVGGLSGWFWSFGNHTTRAICVLMLLGRAVVHLPFAIVRG